MMERSRRLIFLAAAILSATLFLKGHAPSHRNGDVAFLPFTSSGVTIRLKLDTKTSGVYILPKGVTVGDVIKLTAAVPGVASQASPLLDTRLVPGDVLEVTGGNPQPTEISLKKMKAGERLLLGIPLHPDRMDIDDWVSLPGIGAKMARVIVEDRQNNGDFCSVETLRRVPGIGEKKMDMVRKFFDHR